MKIMKSELLATEIKEGNTNHKYMEPIGEKRRRDGVIMRTNNFLPPPPETAGHSEAEGCDSTHRRL